MPAHKYRIWLPQGRAVSAPGAVHIEPPLCRQICYGRHGLLTWALLPLSVVKATGRGRRLCHSAVLLRGCRRPFRSPPGARNSVTCCGTCSARRNRPRRRPAAPPGPEQNHHPAPGGQTAGFHGVDKVIVRVTICPTVPAGGLRQSLPERDDRSSGPVVMSQRSARPREGIRRADRVQWLSTQLVRHHLEPDPRAWTIHPSGGLPAQHSRLPRVLAACACQPQQPARRLSGSH